MPTLIRSEGNEEGSRVSVWRSAVPALPPKRQGESFRMEVVSGPQRTPAVWQARVRVPDGSTNPVPRTSVKEEYESTVEAALAGSERSLWQRPSGRCPERGPEPKRLRLRITTLVVTPGERTSEKDDATPVKRSAITGLLCVREEAEDPPRGESEAESSGGIGSRDSGSEQDWPRPEAPIP